MPDSLDPRAEGARRLRDGVIPADNEVEVIERTLARAAAIRDCLERLLGAMERSVYNTNGRLSPAEDHERRFARELLGWPPLCHECGQEKASITQEDAT